MLADLPLLSLVIWVPIVGGVVALAVAKFGNDGMVRWLSLLFSAATLALSVPLYTLYDTGAVDMQFQESVPWIGVFNFSLNDSVNHSAILSIKNKINNEMLQHNNKNNNEMFHNKINNEMHHIVTVNT